MLSLLFSLVLGVSPKLFDKLPSSRLSILCAL